MAKRLTRCPVCEAALRVTELACDQCGTRVQGAFTVCRFCRLAPEHLAFLETFLRCEGNLSRVEKEWGLSYPTIRNRFAALLAALDFQSDADEANSANGADARRAAPPANPRRLAILEALSKGELSAEEAAIQLRDV